MNDNVYQRIQQSSFMQPSSSSPSLSSVVVDPLPMRRRSNSKSSFWKNWRKYRHTINIDSLVRMRLRWRTVAKILGGILFFKITLSILGSLVGTEPADQFMGMPDAVPYSGGVVLGSDGLVNSSLALLPVVTEPPPPPPIPQPVEAIKCENLRDYQHMVASAPEVDIWQTVQLGISFGYSAFFDDRLDGIASIKVMGLADEWLDAKPPLCQLWFADRVEPFALPVNITNFPAQQTARYKAVMYTCRYTPSQMDMPPPIAVSLSSEACAQPISLFKLHTFDRSTPPESRQKFSVCLASPMRLNFSEPGEMVDWIEVHKLFGVSKYYMYVNDAAANVNPFLDHYGELGEVDTLQWKLPAEIRDPRESVKAFGQLAMINDCLYRNMFKSKYMVFLDLDEMMVPRGLSKTLEETLVTTSCQDKAQTIIRSAFFRKQWTNDEKFSADERIVKRSLVSLLKTKRERKVLAINVHAKYIVIPEMIEALETLAAQQFLATVGNNTGEATCVLLAKECLLHHYRYYEEFAGDWMIDRKMHEFTKSIVERTGAVWDTVNARITAEAVAAAAEAAAAEALLAPPAGVDTAADVVNTESETAGLDGEVPETGAVQSLDGGGLSEVVEAPLQGAGVVETGMLPVQSAGVVDTGVLPVQGAGVVDAAGSPVQGAGVVDAAGSPIQSDGAVSDLAGAPPIGAGPPADVGGDPAPAPVDAAILPADPLGAVAAVIPPVMDAGPAPPADIVAAVPMDPPAVVMDNVGAPADAAAPVQEVIPPV